MKPTLLLLLILALLTGCVETVTTAPDGTVTKTKAPAPGSLELVGQGIAVFGSRIEATK